MNITPEFVEGVKEILNNPSKYNFEYKPFKECFVPSEIVTPKDVLAEQYLAYLKNSAVNKFLVYLLMDDAFGFGTDKTSNGSLGYKLSIHPDILSTLLKDVLTANIF